MNKEILDVLICRCGHRYQFNSTNGNERLICTGCNSTVPIEDNIIVFPVDSVSQSEEVGIRDYQAESWRHRLTDPNQEYKNDPEFQIEISRTIGFLNLKKTDRVLDIGSGAGKIVKEVYNECGLVVAIDFSIECLRVCQEVVGRAENVVLIRGSVCSDDIRFKEKSFDKVICTGVIHLIENELEVHKLLENTTIAMKNDGLGIFIVYNYDWRKKRQHVAKSGFVVSSVQGRRLFRRFYNTNELTNLLQGHFNVEQIIGIDNRLPFSLLGRLGRLGILLDNLLSSTPIGLIYGRLLLVVVKR